LTCVLSPLRDDSVATQIADEVLQFRASPTSADALVDNSRSQRRIIEQLPV
jgi:hypothetical protein